MRKCVFYLCVFLKLKLFSLLDLIILFIVVRYSYEMCTQITIYNTGLPYKLMIAFYSFSEIANIFDEMQITMLR